MSAETDLLALLLAYIGGDALARRVLLDALDEAGDARSEAVRAESIDWDALAVGEALRQWRLNPSAHSHPDSRYVRWLIDCARFGSGTKPEIARAVREARRQWLQTLFPELPLA